VRTAGVVAVGAAVLTTAAGCSGPAGHAEPAGGLRRGGTVYLLAESNGFAHLDPQRTFTTAALNVSRLIYRTLTAFRTNPNGAGVTLHPDLATDLGRASDGNRTWRFTLRTGARWADGEPVTCAQVKYGVQRSFAPAAAAGPSYPRQLLADTAGYHGPPPGDASAPGLSSVRCAGRTVTFHLRRPCGDFGDVVAMPVFAPVRPDLDARGDYDARPASDGPYRIARRTGSELVLTRNRYWRADSDPIRPAYPDRFVVRFGADPGWSTDALVTDRGSARASIQLDYNVPANFVQQVINDPEQSARTVSGPTGAIRYLAINTRRVTDLRCRQAIGHVLDRQAYRMAVGGFVAGDYAATMLPRDIAPTVRHPVVADPAGDLSAAVSLIGRTGRCPDQLTLDYQNVSSFRWAAQTIVDSLQRIGVQVHPNPIPKSRFYDVVGDPRAEHDLVLAAWVPDWPNGSSYLPTLFDGRLLAQNATGGNYNLSQLDDPAVDDMIDTAEAATSRGQQDADWAAVDAAVRARGAVVPILYERGLAMYGGDVGGAVMQPVYGEPDVLGLGLRRA
jgi:peptide/nickel transport system substrate-binding protein